MGLPEGSRLYGSQDNLVPAKNWQLPIFSAFETREDFILECQISESVIERGVDHAAVSTFHALGPSLAAEGLLPPSQASPTPAASASRPHPGVTSPCGYSDSSIANGTRFYDPLVRIVGKPPTEIRASDHLSSIPYDKVNNLHEDFTGRAIP
jgi:hypothetical protein